MMAKKKAKKVEKKKVKKAEKETEVKEEVVSEVVKEKESRTLIWFFLVVAVVFASFLVPYFWVESSKVFQFAGVDWVIEDYDYLEIFHGRFVSLTNPNLNYNVFLRTDPRENDVFVEGRLDDFKYGGVVSLSPEVDACRGELSRVMLDLSAFLMTGVGVGPIESGSTSEEVALQTGRMFANCENVDDRTVVVVDIGESGVYKSEVNPNCYVIYARDCNDAVSVEKFMVQTVIDFRETHGTFDEA